LSAFLYSFNAVFPIFLVTALGYFLRRINAVPESFVAAGTKLTFTVAIPCMVFINILDASIDETFDLKLTIFALVTTLVMVGLLVLVVPRVIKDPPAYTAYIQGAFRSNYLIIGFALINALDPPSLAKAAMLLCIVVPLANIVSVLILAHAKEDQSKRQIWRCIYTNPVIIATTLALLLSVLGIKLPTALHAPLEMLSDMTLPLSLLTLGAAISFRHGYVKQRQVLSASLIKVLLIPLIFIPLAYWFGFRGIDLMLCLILFASPTAISSFPMAYQMGADHRLAGMIIAYSNTFAIFTLFIFIYALRLLGAI
jgi:malate permease and related proteins